MTTTTVERNIINSLRDQYRDVELGIIPMDLFVERATGALLRGITLPDWMTTSTICVGCVYAGAEDWTDREAGLSDPRKCEAKACDACGTRSCFDREDGGAPTVQVDTCTDQSVCEDRDCRSTRACHGCPDCDPDSFAARRYDR